MTERERLFEIIDNYEYDYTRCKLCAGPDSDCAKCGCEALTDYLLDNGVIVPPCKIGDRVWGIRRFHNIERVQEGIVNEMYFTKDMGLQIVIKSVCRGYFGEKIFLSREEAEKALKEREGNA